MAGCKEGNPVMLQYTHQLSAEIADEHHDDITVNAKHCQCKCSAVPVDMKLMATLCGELPNSATYFSFENDKWSARAAFEMTGPILLVKLCGSHGSGRSSLMQRQWNTSRRLAVPMTCRREQNYQVHCSVQSMTGHLSSLFARSLRERWHYSS